MADCVDAAQRHTWAEHVSGAWAENGVEQAWKSDEW